MLTASAARTHRSAPAAAAVRRRAAAAQRLDPPGAGTRTGARRGGGPAPRKQANPDAIVAAGGRRGSASPLAFVEHGAAGGAEIAAVVGHACADPLNVGDVLVAEPHRVRLAGRALF